MRQEFARNLFTPSQRVCTALLWLTTWVVLSLPAHATPIPERWTGDLDQMLEYRVIRALVPYSKTYYFLDKGKPRGLTYESLIKFETQINKEQKSRHLRIHVVVIPTPRDRLLQDLVQGKGDIAAGNLTITNRRNNQVDFSDPFLENVKEILVTGPGAPEIKTLDDLSRQRVHVRPSSSYYDSLLQLNNRFRSRWMRTIRIVKMDEFLEDEDLLEMVNANMIPMVVVDDHKARFWAKILPNITLHEDLAVREQGQIAWAIRKNSPQLKARINAFIKTHKKGTLYGNIIFERYLKNTKYVEDPGPQNKFDQTTAIFQKYAKQYGFDWLFLKALAFQESGINQSKKSQRGAVGVMQVLPSTARDPNVNIKNIDQLDNNIHAGTKYLRFIMDRYFNDPEIEERDRVLLSLAAYNAGPRRVADLRKTAEELDLNPNVWFQNVEVAAARKIGRETVQYVNNIFKYYISYTRMYALADQKPPMP